MRFRVVLEGTGSSGCGVGADASRLENGDRVPARCNRRDCLDCCLLELVWHSGLAFTKARVFHQDRGDDSNEVADDLLTGLRRGRFREEG